MSEQSRNTRPNSYSSVPGDIPASMRQDDMETILQNMESVLRVRNRKSFFHPMREIGGFKTCPGYCLQNGAFELPGGINFTITSQGATSVELVLFKRRQSEPFAVLPFPDEYRVEIGRASCRERV